MLCPTGCWRAVQAIVDSVARLPWTGRKPHVVVACNTLKGSRSDWLVEKCVELGAHTLTPLLTQRSREMPGAANRSRGSDDDESSSGRSARWQRLRVAAVKQCLRTHDMSVSSPWTIDELVGAMRAGGTRCFVAAEGGEPVLQALETAAVREPPEDRGPAALMGPGERDFLVVGPEGDFTEGELRLLRVEGAVLVGLGTLRLRTETAALALLTAHTLRSSQ